MGLLDSNIFKQATKSINISGPATTNNSYLNGWKGVIDVSKYSTLCFQVKTITAGVKFRCNGGITSSNTLEAYGTHTNELHLEIDKAGTYWCDVSAVKSFGFYITKGVENGQLDIDICLKTVPTKKDLKPIQSLYTETKTLSAGATSVISALYSLDDLFRYFKFITVYANFAKTKTHITLSTSFMFQGMTPYMKEQEEVSNSGRIYSDWIPIISSSPVIRLDFAEAAAEGDTVYIEVKGIR